MLQTITNPTGNNMIQIIALLYASENGGNLISALTNTVRTPDDPDEIHVTDSFHEY